MKFRARFADEKPRTREIEVVTGTSPLEVRLDGVSVAADVVRLGPNAYSIVLPDGRHAEATVHDGGDGNVDVRIGVERLVFEFQDDLTARALAASGRGRAKKGGDLKAAIPGRVVRVLVSKGDSVPSGKTLLVLEAMKMENEVRAPRDARVKSIEVEAGQAVATGDVLVRFETD